MTFIAKTRAAIRQRPIMAVVVLPCAAALVALNVRLIAAVVGFILALALLLSPVLIAALVIWWARRAWQRHAAPPLPCGAPSITADTFDPAVHRQHAQPAPPRVSLDPDPDYWAQQERERRHLEDLDHLDHLDHLAQVERGRTA